MNALVPVSICTLLLGCSNSAPPREVQQPAPASVVETAPSPPAPITGPKILAIEGAAWALQIDSPGIDRIDAIVADDQGVTLLGRYEYELDLGGEKLVTPPDEEEFEFNFFLGRFSKEGKPQWSKILGGAAPGSSAMAASSKGGVLALVPIAQVEGPSVLERVHAVDGKLKRTKIQAGKTALLGGVAVSDKVVVASREVEDSDQALTETALISGAPPHTILARSDNVGYASADGLFLAGSFYESWKFETKNFTQEGCDDDDISGCEEAFVLALTPEGKLRWALQLGDQYQDDDAGPIASHPQGGVALRVRLEQDNEYQVGGKKVRLGSNTLLKLTHDGKAQWSATPSNAIRDMIVTASGEVYAIGIASSHYYDEGKRKHKSELVLSHFDKAGNATVRGFGDQESRKRSPRIALSPNGAIYLTWNRALQGQPSESILMRVDEKAKP